ncbi:hypothetical protein IRZ59_20350 [Pseudomonas guariconensis]|uniref:hypothetical protein n=1 Tax=Pseudomonas guariconensis TaxID=1288410 RepID=UPI0018A90EDB|nr:hypothetical protein [Pseudomonas guariconensis]MBF8732790.1 hypothetical protein [Pseudomonas guariconensis]
MSQFDYGVIDPNSKSGPQLALDLNSFRDALHSLHRGASRPAYVQPGMLWVQEVSSARWDLVIYDGTNDLVLRSFNPTTSELAQFNTSEVDGLDSALSLAVQKDAAGTTGAAFIPSGTDAQRPGTPVAGMLRYNADAKEMERYQDGKWLTLNVLDKALNEAPIVTLASAATVNIGAALANTINISGTTTINSLGTIAAGARRTLIFQGALTLTHNATSLILPSGADIVTKAGETADFISLGSGNWRCIEYRTNFVTRALPKLAISFSGQATPPSIYQQDGEVKVTSITRVSTGTFDLNLDRAITTSVLNLVCPGMSQRVSGGLYSGFLDYDNTTTTKLRVITRDTAGINQNVAPTSFVFYAPEN